MKKAAESRHCLWRARFPQRHPLYELVCGLVFALSDSSFNFASRLTSAFETLNFFTLNEW
jgi:hypothetical protein